MTSKIVVNNIEADSGINTVTFGGDISGNFVGNVTGNVNATGVSTFSDTVNVGAGKSVRIFGSASGYSDLIAPAVAGDQTFTLPGTGGTLDRLNRAGNILQVVNAVYSTESTSSSSTFADTGLTATITPSSSSSKILVLVNQAGCLKTTNDTQIRLALLRGVTNILNFERLAGYTNSSASNGVGSCSLCYLDSPATTSATTYKTQFASANNNAEVRVQINSGGSPSSSTITLLEVAA